MKLYANNKCLDLSFPQIMGILNFTPDSFSDSGQFFSLDKALFQVEKMLKEGATIIDIGGESTRPGHIKITEQEEIERIVPVIRAVKERFDIPVSIDSYKGSVVEAALECGADMVNDVWGFKYDEKVADADLVIVGEGRLDAQSLAGKAPIGVAKRTPKGVPVIAICGSLAEDLPSLPFENIIAAFSILEKSEPLEDSLKNAATYLEHTAASVAQILSLKKN